MVFSDNFSVPQDAVNAIGEWKIMDRHKALKDNPDIPATVRGSRYASCFNLLDVCANTSIHSIRENLRLARHAYRREKSQGSVYWDSLFYTRALSPELLNQ